MLGLFNRRDEPYEPPEELAVASGPPARRIRRIVVAFEPPEPSSEALETAIELGLRHDAVVLLACAVEWHPRYGGAEGAEGVRRNVQAAVDRIRAAGVAARGNVSVTLVGEGAGLLAQEATESGAGLMIVATPRRRRWLHAIGMDFAQRMIRASRMPVLLLPGDAPARVPGRIGRRRRTSLQVVGGR